jgi:hypothetical protein
MSIYQPPSFIQTAGDGVTVAYSVPFPYADRSHVFCTVNGVNATFTWVSDALIQLAVAPANGAQVRRFRKTPSGLPLVDFNPGAALQDEDLNLATLQALYVAREAEDAIGSSLKENVSGQLDASGRRITGVAPPSEASDVVTKAYADSLNTPSAAASAAAAAASQTAANASADAAAASEVSAAASAAAAQTFVPANYALLVGATFSGDITISRSAGVSKRFLLGTAGSLRWEFGADSTAESGSNSGTNFFLSRYTDGGLFAGSPITINRATGQVSLETTPLVGANIVYHAGNVSLQRLPAVSAKSGAYTVVLEDHRTLFNCTGTFTMSLTSAATLADGFEFDIYNNGSGNITIDPNASQTINGQSTAIVYPGGYLRVRCTGTAWTALGRDNNPAFNTPRPTASAGVGQWVGLAPAVGAGLQLPTGGSWAYAAYRFSSGTVTSAVFGVSAGGTVLDAGVGGQNWQGFAWRIA